MQYPAQSQWFREHGIDPGDWSAVYPVLLASWRVHGIPSALDRAQGASQHWVTTAVHQDR